ncbi:MAG: hypothetical protein HYZ37_08730 [Candidatus Solibacter usitatus]|nr:hypothetical protein [Candidatus Solibacter usitatus]
MALITVPPRPDLAQKFRLSFYARAERQDPLSQEIHVPVDVSTVENITAGKCAEGAEWSGCVFFCDQMGEAYSCEMTSPDLYGSASFRGLASGPEADEALRLISKARGYYKTTSGDYELRLFSVPGLYLEAFRLLSMKPGEPDLYVPWITPIEDWKHPEIQESGDFFKLIEPVAQRRVRPDGADPLMA